jgi:hypothetical protein
VQIKFKKSNLDLEDISEKNVIDLLSLKKAVSFQNTYFFIHGTNYPMKFESIKSIILEHFKCG